MRHQSGCLCVFGVKRWVGISTLTWRIVAISSPVARSEIQRRAKRLLIEWKATEKEATGRRRRLLYGSSDEGGCRALDACGTNLSLLQYQTRTLVVVTR